MNKFKKSKKLNYITKLSKFRQHSIQIILAKLFTYILSKSFSTKALKIFLIFIVIIDKKIESSNSSKIVKINKISTKLKTIRKLLKIKIFFSKIRHLK